MANREHQLPEWDGTWGEFGSEANWALLGPMPSSSNNDDLQNLMWQHWAAGVLAGSWMAAAAAMGAPVPQQALARGQQSVVLTHDVGHATSCLPPVPAFPLLPNLTFEEELLSRLLAAPGAWDAAPDTWDEAASQVEQSPSRFESPVPAPEQDAATARRPGLGSGAVAALGLDGVFGQDVQDRVRAMLFDAYADDHAPTSNLEALQDQVRAFLEDAGAEDATAGSSREEPVRADDKACNPQTTQGVPLRIDLASALGLKEDSHSGTFWNGDAIEDSKKIADGQENAADARTGSAASADAEAVGRDDRDSDDAFLEASDAAQVAKAETLHEATDHAHAEADFLGSEEFVELLRRRPLPRRLATNHRRLRSWRASLRSSVRALYRERIEPTLPEVKRRLRAWGWPCREVELALLPLAAADKGALRVVPPRNAKLPRVLLVQTPAQFAGFVDKDEPDVYPICVWQALKSFLEAQRPSFRGGVNGAAEDLRRRGPAELRNLSLGELRHIVELAVGPKQLLMYAGHVLQVRPSSHQRQRNRQPWRKQFPAPPKQRMLAALCVEGVPQYQ